MKGNSTEVSDAYRDNNLQQQSQEQTISSINCRGNWTATCKNNETRPLSYTIHKNYVKCNFT